MTSKTSSKTSSPKTAQTAVPGASPAALPPKRAARAAKSTQGEPLIEVFPHGISVTTSIGRPVLILKDRSHIEVLPVWMQALDAGVAMAELSHGSGATPHSVTRRLFDVMRLKLESCIFTELVGHHQFVDLLFRGGQGTGGSAPQDPRLVRVRADEAMSFCLQARARFFVTKSYAARARDLDVDLNKLEHHIEQGLLPELKAEIETGGKKHPYLM